MPATLLVATLFVARGQAPKDADLGHGLPDLKQKQIEDLLKDDKKKSVADTAEILERANALKEELEMNDQHVLSMKAIKDVEEIEKLAKRIRGRMRRF